MSSTNPFDFGPYDHSDRDFTFVRSSSNSSDGLASRMGELSVHSESSSDGSENMMEIGVRKPSSTVGDPCRRAEDFHLSTWRPINQMRPVESASFCMNFHPLMNFCFIHLRNQRRHMLVWHGPAREFVIHFVYERFWPEATAQCKRLERHGQPYPGRIPKEGIKALCTLPCP